MKVNATQSKQIEVELDFFTIREIVISQFCNVFNIKDDYYIKDGKIVRDVEHYGGSHSWYDEETIREATEEDKTAILMLKKLKEKL